MHHHRGIIVGSAGLHTSILMAMSCLKAPLPVLIAVDPIHAPAVEDAEIVTQIFDAREEEKKRMRQLVIHQFVQCSRAEDFAFQMNEGPKKPFYHGVPRRKRGRR